MLFFLGLIAAEYLKFARENKYVGLVDGNKLGKVDEREAVNFLRAQADDQKIYTTLKSGNAGIATFNKQNEMVVGSGDTKFLISLDMNGKYVLIADDKCVMLSGEKLRRGPCKTSEDVAYFDLKPFPDSVDYSRKSIVVIGQKKDAFNPEDPLAEQLNEGKPAADEENEKVMLPYKERLKGRPQQEIEDMSKAKRILAKHNVF